MKHSVAVPIGFLALMLPLVARANNHLVRFEQVFAGANGRSDVQFVEIKFFPGQNLWGPQPGEVESRAMLTFHDATGLKTAEFKFPSNPPTGPQDPENSGHSALVATQAFVDATGLAADFVIPPHVMAIDGMVCFTANPANPVFDVNLCLSYGNYVGPTEFDDCGNPNGPPAAPLPIAGATPQSLNRFSNDGALDFGCHLNADFELQAPSPRNSAGQTATLPAASLVEQGEALFSLETFDGNGRTCVTCHTPEDQFGLTPATIANRFTVDPTDPLFVAENDPNLSQLENACLMRMGNVRGLILENIDGFANPPVFRNSPHLLNIALTAPYGLSDVAANLRDFCQGAIQQHFPRTLARNADPSAGPLDFRLATDFELEAMEAFMNAIAFPPDGNLDIDRMITAAIAGGADAATIQRGRNLFFGNTGSAQCFRCHSGPALADADGSLGTGTGNRNFNTGVVDLPANDDDGCSGGPGDPIASLPAEEGGLREFNTPPLIGVALTAPFFHDNSAAALHDAVAFYDSAPFAASPAAQLLPAPIVLTSQHIDDLTAFLEAVSVDPTGVSLPEATVTQILDATAPCVGPTRLATDLEGNAYVTCRDTDNAVRVSPSGAVVEIIDAAGDGLGHALDSPFGIAVAADGNVYVSGSSSHNAFRITPPFPGGTITQIIDASGGTAVQGSGTAPLQFPRGMTVDAAGNAYLAGSGSDNVFRIEPGGAIQEIIDFFGDGRGATPCSACPLDVPHDVAVDASGNVYVTGFVSHNTFKIEPGPGGAITEVFDFTQCLGIPPLTEGPALDGFGNVIQSGVLSNNAVRINPAAPLCSDFSEIIDEAGDGTHLLFQAQMVAADAAGNAYVTGTLSRNAFKIAPDGRITQCIDSSGDGIHPLAFPSSIAVDARGNVFVTGDTSNNVFKIEGCGTVLCGNGTVDPGEQCDDGNRSDGDCCSAHCLFEPAGAACDDGESCTGPDQCDGAGACVPGACRVDEPCGLCGMSCQIVEGDCECAAE